MCVLLCPTEALTVSSKYFAEVVPDRCKPCQICVHMCPTEALEDLGLGHELSEGEAWSS
jgi:Pyruvate/2-oxoacid:ferredoxin oxidoreductase delta subunit